MNKLRVLCLVLLALSCDSNNPNQGGTPVYDPYNNRATQQQQNGGKNQHEQQRPLNGQQQTQGYQQEQQQSQQQQQQQQLPYSQAWPPSQIAQSAPPINGMGAEMEAYNWNDPRYYNPPHGAHDNYQSQQPPVSNSNNHNSNGYQPDDRDVYDPSYSLPNDTDNTEDGYGVGDEDELYLGLERIVAEDGFPRVTDITASLSDILPHTQGPGQGQGQASGQDTGQRQAGGPSTSSQVLFGSDLSQLDKDLIFEGLKKLYKKKVLPLELASKYSHFSSPPLGPSDFEAKPMVLILGQYSVGKTSFIRSLVKQDFPGQRIGPEPTTDRFTAIMHSTEGNEGGRQIPGHALVMQQDRPFRGLASFGNNFLSKFEGAEVTASILRNITIVDTPGVLAGEKQRIGRDYDFGEVIKWFAERADMIIVMFDAHKLDISDELKTVLDVLKPHQDKIRVLLNKADTIDAQALLRVYGSLMWSLGKVVQTPEVCRVFLGSFWEAPLRLEDNRQLLEREKQDLLNEMMALPQNAVVRRINELVKRARSVKVHAYIIHYLKKQMPYVIGKSEKQKKLLDRLDREFLACARRYNLPLGDFPNVDQYRKMLREIKDISDFKRLDKNMVAEMDRVLTHDIPLLLQKATNSPIRRAPAVSQSQQQQQQQQQYGQHQHQNQQYQQQHHHQQQQQPPTSAKSTSKGFFW